jgi:type I restriction enzyme S subunit
MDTNKLRQKILDLAIRGKLVSQDPNDEPASVLIEKIRSEKERLIKEKKIKRDKNESYIYRSDKSYYEKFADGTVKCIDEEIPFEIPESWEWCRLGNLCPSLQYGTSEKSQSEGEVAVLRMGNILSSGELSYKDLVFTSNESDIIKYALVPGDLLFNRTNSSEWVGKTAIYRGYIPAIYAGYIIRFRPILLNLEYVNFVMNSGYEKDYCQSVKTDGVNQSNINAQKLAYFLIPVPPSQEQTRLVFEIQNIFSPIATLEENKISLEQLINQAKSKILDLAIRGKLVPQDPNDEPASVLLERIKIERPQSKKTTKSTSDNSHYTFDIPKAWEWTTIGDISEHNTGKTLDKGRNSGILYKYITTSNLYWDSFVLDNLKEMPFEENELDKCSAIKGDLLICEGGDGGRSAIWNKEYPICFQNHIHRVRPLSGIKSKYLYFFMLYSYLNGNINYYKKGIGIQSLSGSSLSSIKVPLPPIHEQDRIVKKIEDIFSSLDEIANSIKA